MDPKRDKATAVQKELAAKRAKREVKVLPRNDAFTEHSIKKVLERIQIDRNKEEVVEWARLENAKGGNPLGKKARAALLLKAWRAQFGYSEDPVDAEFIAKTQDIMCLPGHDYCLMGGDCEEATLSLCAEMSSIGLTVAIVVVRFRPGTPKEQRHLMGAVLTEEGWLRFDPSYFDELGKVITTDKQGKYIPRQERWIDVMSGAELHRGDGSTTPTEGVSSKTLLAARPNLEYVGINGVSLGEADAATQMELIQAWGPWLLAYKTDLDDAFSKASAAIAALQDTRDKLGIDQYDPEGSPGWTPSISKLFYTTFTTAYKDLSDYAAQALAGTRKSAWYENANGDGQGSLALVQMPGDLRAYSLGAQGQVIVTDVPQQNPGLGGLVAEIGSAALSVTALGVYLNITRGLRDYQRNLEIERQRDLAKATDNLIASGADPDTIKKFLTAMTPPSGKNKQSSAADWANLIDKVVTGVVIIAGVGFLWVVGEKVLEAQKAKRLVAA